MTGDDSSVAPPALREVISAYGLDADKRLGQHFLLDLNITRKIATLADVKSGDRVLEIGPGPGGLTRALLERGARVVAVERDPRCVAALADLAACYDGLLEIIEGDALTIDERTIVEPPAKIVSNLPYNISTELLVKWLRANAARARPLWSGMALMFQKEVADRILAAPNSKTYGRLSVIAQLAATPKRGFDLPARAFTPPPKVDSTVVLFAPSSRAMNISLLEKVTQAAFSQRRKMLRTSLSRLYRDALADILEKCAIDPTARAENLSPDQYLDIVNQGSPTCGAKAD